MKNLKKPLLNVQKITRQHIPLIDFHMHTRWTDGKNSVFQMHEKAKLCGLNSILFSEHSRKTSGDWFPKFVQEVKSLSNEGCAALVGVETKGETFEGDLDITEEILSQCDLVIASVHRFPGERGTVRGFGDIDPSQAAALELKLAMAIMDNPRVDILAHPFGMCYRRYHVAPAEDQIRLLIEKSAETGTAFEINCHYHPDPWQLIDWCLSARAPISLGSNAHDIESVGKITRVLEGKENAWSLLEC